MMVLLTFRVTFLWSWNQRYVHAQNK